MADFKEYISSFFSNLEIYEDLYNDNNYKGEISESINNFIEESSPEMAYKVYESFFKAYWIGIQGDENPFLKLTEKMQHYEKLAGQLTLNQRDHYVHSVLVFLLGIAIYEQNSKYKDAFTSYALDTEKYPDHYQTENEEFFYRWGLASLFHDIAYPLEISLKQVVLYTEFICSYPNKSDDLLQIKMELCNFEKFTDIPVIEPNEKHIEEFNKKYPGHNKLFHSDAMAILSESISNSLDLNFNDVNKNIREFVGKMESLSFIDHGFYSAVIMLRWYHHLVKSTKWHPGYFYYPIADAASAIFLHNYFEHGIRNKFDIKRLEASTHPIAYLLILCDHLQEWKRECYGQKSDSNEYPINFELMINDSTLKIKYIYAGEHPTKHPSIIQNKINELLSISSIFSAGLLISN